MNQTRKIRWLIAHEPVELFLRTAEAFKEKIAELTDGKFEIEIYTAGEYKAKFHHKVVDGVWRLDPMDFLDSGNIEMSQLHITELAKWHSTDFYALEMPFLFRDHDHAARVLEGPIGSKLLNKLTEVSPATGLAFTYSGGYRIVASDTPVISLEDLKGCTFATGHNPVTVDTVEAIGAVPKSFHIKDFLEKINSEGLDSDAYETTIPRYLARLRAQKQSMQTYLVNTKHSLFLTSIIASNKFLASLDEETLAKFKEASVYASKLEREWSVEEAEQFANKQDHSDIGLTYRELSAEETAKFKELVQPLYDKYTDFFEAGLVDGIIKS
jgi:TRAP-type C4-dicarboxylate transport system substrate-binding protein